MDLDDDFPYPVTLYRVPIHGNPSKKVPGRGKSIFPEDKLTAVANFVNGFLEMGICLVANVFDFPYPDYIAPGFNA